ncbi:ATP-binding cassette domain-containing protein [Streptomyces sp. Z26]|uniref:ABC transporter ATP-binding protein n=1 Tax=Streptomyces sp. Z26 TaxID=2500177 RepID=UPI000EF14385|nr:ATP-binding cassette domain-containing protein [Streptomyces sp. Z26]RLL66665.1 ABC transporter ATP-binding protein [Streptomyces sp. Z26]
MTGATGREQPGGDGRVGSPYGPGPLVEVRGLTARAGTATLLDGVDLTVTPGTATALVGPSGSGKTTAALALLGEAAPGVRLAGSVRVGGVAVVDDDGPAAGAADVRGRLLAYMPQHPAHALNPARRIGAVLTELARLHRPFGTGGRSAAEAYAAGALHTAGLTPDPGGKGMDGGGEQGGGVSAAEGRALRRRFPHQFSGGQRQRVALAQALACGPRVLVLDEPSTGLDTVARARLAGQLNRLVADGFGVLLLSHDHDLVRAVAPRTVLLDRGRVADTGATADVLPPPRPAPQRPYTDRPLPPPAAGDTAVPALVAHGLTAWLRTGRRGAVLHDVSVTVPEGGCVAVVGPSGSGKTVLARCLAGLHERHDGRLVLRGEPLPVLRRRTARQIRGVQYVWQEVRGSFDERRTVLEQVARTAVRLRGLPAPEAAERARRIAERLGLTPAQLTRYAAELSGGELQRAALVRALLAAPDVLVCDEITTALDATATALVTAEIARLRGRGTAVLWVGHDLALVEELADTVVILDAGSVVEAGNCRTVLASPRSGTARLLLRSRRLGAEVPAVPPEAESPEAVPPETSPPEVRPPSETDSPVHREDRPQP